MYKMIVLDLDGTLLNNREEISELTANVLIRAAKSMKIVLASARGYYRIKPYVERLCLENDNQCTIAYNGSMIIHHRLGVSFQNHIAISDMKKLLKLIQNEMQISWIFYTDSASMKRCEIEDIVAFIEKNRIYKVVALGKSDEISIKKEKIVSTYEKYFEITSSVSNRLEFVAKGMTKVSAIEQVAAYYHLQRHEIMAIGDGENDIDMLRYAGLGIAMKNASDAVKQAADRLTDDNEHDGVGKVVLALKHEHKLDFE